eukprot:TRINITY_DN6939_c0_g1::TRINITY_DN6939_c0_g1_i1::g.13400::m.13400 TRINITY_DN6939_c0_g1::TRINITY_DN6939_c0_g1_i1::g.13400  ORF type:complete len:287 (+),score=33.12,sp/Q2QPW1/GMK1_ORYSJ/57.30/4e-71,Guanylate_kin/PF00625.16/2.2e-60,AAA_33/PF13671.1/3.2e+03,AAA_33/PF13671.1/8.3e-05,DUF258/PF03193.11/3.1e+03,DUF258/PF03193.11/0.0015,AAA_17/PF13207.1/0.0013,AAA_22/PF13401.1/0.01,AAA_22/PF13401.1/3.8e+02,AAA_16/PF13191.1/0.0059,AAA_18/PF13238.1/0.013,Miro/PF08477.8/0.015,RNA_helicase/PF00910.17/0.065,AA
MDFETEAAIKEHSGLLKTQNEKYLQSHPEIRQMLDDFLTACLIKRPVNVYRFAGSFFSSYAPSTQVGRTHTTRPLTLRPLVVCGPSGVGKGTIIQKLMQSFPDDFGFSVSHTTRKPREGEKHGVHYYYTDIETMRKEIEQGKFIEYAEVHGNLYGTSLEAVKRVSDSGRICVLDIDVQGCRLVKQTDLNPFCLFVSPPSLDSLEARLRGRATETEEAIQKRLKNAKGEMDATKEPGLFNQIIVNDELDEAFERFKISIGELFAARRRAALLQVIAKNAQAPPAPSS